MQNKKRAVLIFGLVALIIFIVVGFRININPFTQRANPFPAVIIPIPAEVYYTFDGPNVQSSSGINTSVTFGNTSQAGLINSYKKTSGTVGNYLQMPFSTSSPTPEINLGTITGVTNQLSVQVLLRLDDTGEVYFIRSADFDINLKQPRKDIESNATVSEINFATRNSSGNLNILQFKLDGINRKSISYYYEKPRLLTFTYGNGIKRIYVDGLLVASQNDIATLGGTQNFVVGSNSAYRTLFAKVFDEVAIYKNELPGNLVYQNSLDITAGNHYTYVTGITTVPVTPALTASLDPIEFLPNANINNTSTSVHTTYGNQTPPSLLTQLQTYPAPRLNKGTTLERNVLWDDLDYLYSPNPTSFTGNRETIYAWGGVEMSKELYKNWGFRYPLAVQNAPTLTLTPNDYIKKSFDEFINPEISQGKTVYVGMLTNISNGPKLYDIGTYGNQYCLQNSAGNKINSNGQVITTGCQWRPTTPTSFFDDDGLYYAPAFTTIKNQVSDLTKFNLHVIDNDETTGTASGYVPNTNTVVLSLDPAVVSAANQSGLSLSKYEAQRYAAIFNNYKSKFLTNNFPNSSFAVYAHDGASSDRKITFPRFNWTKAREMQRLIGTNRYATPDIYSRYQPQWGSNNSADHGLNWALYSAYEQNQSGDKFFSPFVNQGWWENITYNILPSNYLGVMKMLSGLGAEYSYVSYFNNVPSSNSIVGWPQSRVAYLALPTYAKAPFTKMDTFYKNSDLMIGDMPLRYEYWGIDPIGYEFASGERGDSLTIVRKLNNSNKYIIISTLQPSTSMAGATPDTRALSIKLAGQKITFDSRRVGSIYYFDNTNTSSPIFYQLDSWHEAKHPWYWSPNFSAEAEVFDTGTPTIVTTGQGVSNRDFSDDNYDTYITGNASYNFQAKNGTTSTLVNYPTLLVRGRSSDGSNASAVFKVDNGVGITVSTNNQGFCWMKVDNAPSLQGITPNIDHTLSFTGDTKFQFDKIVLERNSNVNGYTLCGPGVDTIAPSIPTALVSSAVTSNSATLSWAVSTDNVGVTQYKIYKNGVYDTISNINSINLTGLAPSTTYSFAVSAVDLAGNESNQSTILSVTTLNGNPGPLSITLMTPQAGSIFNKNSTITMTANLTGDKSLIHKVSFTAIRTDITNTNERKKCTVKTGPFNTISCDWLTAGTWIQTNTIPYKVRAVAYDASGNILQTSDANGIVNIIVNP